MISRLSIHREYGFPGTRTKIEKAIQQKVADNIAKDRFSFLTITLPTDSYYDTYRNGDFVAVLSMNKVGQIVQKLALWSLPIARKLWELTIDSDYKGLNPGMAALSNSGMVVVDSPAHQQYIIAFKNEISGKIEKPEDCKILLVANRILGWWGLNNTFGEWNQKGELLRLFRLGMAVDSIHFQYSADKNFWVRLGGRLSKKNDSIIDVMDRITGKMIRQILPHNPFKEVFTSSCIVQNRLFYGKNQIRDTLDYEPSICVYDLVNGKLTDEFPTGLKVGKVKTIVANEHFVVWLNFGPLTYFPVQYLNLATKEVKNATLVPWQMSCNVIDLNIIGSILSVTYPIGYAPVNTGMWERKVIDLTTGETKCTVNYKRVSSEKCSIQDGHLLISDCRQLYVESFFDESSSKEESPFRIRNQNGVLPT